MKRKHLVLMLLALMSVSVQAQTDDMYFVPKKATKTPSTPKTEQIDRPAYYVGSNRNVDEYNRRGRFRSSYQSIGNDSVSDVINFSAGNGIYPDSAYIDTSTVYSREGYDGECYDDDDYRYCRRMQRFDDWYDPWYYSYGPWYSPYRYAYWGGWYDPWYYDYYGWYSPWHYGYYGWGWPYYSSYYWGGWGSPYWARPVIAVGPAGHTGTMQRFDRHAMGAAGNYANTTTRINNIDRRVSAYRNSNSGATFGGRRGSTNSYSNSNTFDRSTTSRMSSPSFGGNRSNSSFGNSGGFGSARGGGSFGGGGGFGGGSRGGGFGGGGRVGGRR